MRTVHRLGMNLEARGIESSPCRQSGRRFYRAKTTASPLQSSSTVVVLIIGVNGSVSKTPSIYRPRFCSYDFRSETSIFLYLFAKSSPTRLGVFFLAPLDVCRMIAIGSTPPGESSSHNHSLSKQQIIFRRNRPTIRAKRRPQPLQGLIRK